MKELKMLFVAFLLLLTAGNAKAQCTFHNTAFKSGEFLAYNLYYNWKFVWVKAGTASMSTVQTKYRGHNAYRCSLITRGNDKVDNFFVLRDTLLCYNTTELAPLYFRKGAREGKRYTVDEVFYSYSGGDCHVNQQRYWGDDGHVDKEKHTYQDCVFDMMSIFMRARSFVPDKWKTGNVVKFPIVDGRNNTPAQIRFDGRLNIKADNGHKYRCLRLAYMELEDGKYKRIVDFYVTDDSNHIPVRLDMYLRFGAAKAFLTGIKGNKSPITSKID